MSDYKTEQAKTREALKPKFTPREKVGEHLIQVGTKLQYVNRETARKRVVDRKMTKKGFVYGRKMGSPEDRAIERIAQRQSKWAD